MATTNAFPTPAAARLAALSALLLAVLALALVGPAAALARGGGDDPPGDDHGGGNSGRGGGETVPAQPARRAEVRVAGSCGRGATAKLKLKEDDGGIEAELEIVRSTARGSWRVVMVHERRVEYRGRIRTNSTGWAQVHSRLPDYRGADAVLARAYGPRGITCTATAVLPGV
ncbi:MAG: hypothetical protein QOD81_3411 [Solirubrobacteraceae bacterium]|jgi:hypothetical protein|nr:hypothetical protein [Solirubrobacteraceae bacterium]